MKTFLLIPLLAVAGCISPNLAKFQQALGKDPATVSLRITTIYGTLYFTRTNPTTNTANHAISPDGAVTVGK